MLNSHPMCTECTCIHVYTHVHSVHIELGICMHIQSSDRSACIWDSRSGQCVQKFDGHESDVNAVRFLPTGDAIGTACNDGTVSMCIQCHVCVMMALYTYILYTIM